jgi:hypothetical protein
VTRPPVPHTRNPKSEIRNPIDGFVLAKLQEKGLEPAGPASKVALLRRVYYTLIGLPPSPAEVDAFLADQSADAYEKVVEKLLASPQYGEHWARHWLDVVRYAETNSFERDGAKPFVWRYRDYVVNSFNADKPYDQFIREQLAGDELPTVTPETLIATGYYRLGLWDDEPADPELAYYDGLDDILSTTGQAFLGLTVGCARCHDHKIDPFPAKDYYKLLAFMHGVRHYGDRSAESVAKASLIPIADPKVAELQAAAIAEHNRKLLEIEKQLRDIEKPVAEKLTGGEKDDFTHEVNKLPILRKNVGKLLTQETLDDYQRLRKQRTAHQKQAPRGLDQALVVKESGPKPQDTFILLRGNHQSKGPKVEPGFPSVLTDAAPQLPMPAEGAKSAGRRKVLADWVADPKNALTARVMVNRVWQFHFGRGIVRSSSNFGYGGTPPTHPELLDWLASEFVSNGWRMKPLHRQIVLSNAFRMSAQGDPKTIAADPENDLFGRFDMRRLSAEEVRDSILAVSGNLNPKAGGPSVYPPIPKEVMAGQSQPGAGWPTSTATESARRSVYVHVKRSMALPVLAVFDAADPDAPCPVRFVTTQPAQALGLINSQFVNEQARVFADTVKDAAKGDPAGAVKVALKRVTQRDPSPAEVERGLKFIADAKANHQLTDDEALRRFCLLALNLNEFLYLD